MLSGVPLAFFSWGGNAPPPRGGSDGGGICPVGGGIVRERFATFE